MDAKGYLVQERMDPQKIAQVKFCWTNKSSKQWIGMYEGKIKEIKLTEDYYVERQFGTKLKEECQSLRSNKFLLLPIRSCKSSLMKMFPELNCENTPAMW